MDKRFILFITLSAAILLGFQLVNAWLAPPPPPGPENDVAEMVAELDAPGEDAEQNDDGDNRVDDAAAPGDDDSPPAAPDEQARPDEAAPDQPPERQAQAQQVRMTLGSLDPESGFPFLITFNSRGSAIERIELNSPRYREINHRSGYLGNLALASEPTGGCRVNVVGPETPAALAPSSDPAVGPGLAAGDVLRAIDGQEINAPQTLADYLATTEPKSQVTLSVSRQVGGAARQLQFTATLIRKPLQLIQPEEQDLDESPVDHPLSCLLTLHTIGSVSAIGDHREITGLPSLRDNNWSAERIDENTVEFRYRLDSAALSKVEQSGDIEVVRRYRVTPRVATAEGDDGFKPHHLGMEIEIINHGAEPIKVAYRLDGPNGLPLEGWWYTNKVHPNRFTSGGARDIAWRTVAGGHHLRTCNDVFKQAVKEKTPRSEAMLPERPVGDEQEFRYAGIDTLYFAAMLVPAPVDMQSGPQGTFTFASAESYPLNDIVAPDIEKSNRKRYKHTNVSFDMVSPVLTIPPSAPNEQGRVQGRQVADLALFAGPKEPELLAEYGLGDLVVYGWFAPVAWVMVSIVHFFYGVTHSYGLSIILLTILVRSCMFPISRKAAKNAARMQELAPEIKKINEKYKTDMEKRTKAQQDLWKKHNYNPFGGCLLMFLQLPVFIGLYKSLSVDIELRQRPLIPGLDWCSNLAGPDQLLYWQDFLFKGLGGEAGWLGPYLNILPLITVVLFFTQQKLFTPPATDEQTRMTQQMMGFMTLFIGLMFFKVPSGLCLYFITSSTWGICERLLLPKPSKPPEGQSPPPAKEEKKSLLSAWGAKPDLNGASRKAKSKNRKRQKRR